MSSLLRLVFCIEENHMCWLGFFVCNFIGVTFLNLQCSQCVMFSMFTSQFVVTAVCAVRIFGCVISLASYSWINTVHNVYFSVPSHPSVCCKDLCMSYSQMNNVHNLLLSVRSPQWLRGKWWSLKRHVPDYQEMDFQGKSILFSLSVFYLSSACERNRPYGLCQSSLFNHSVDCHMF